MTDREKLVELLDYICYSQEFSCYDLYDLSDAAEPIAGFLISKGVTVQRWVPVTESLPQPNVLVLCVWLDLRNNRQIRGFATYQPHGVWYVSNEGMPEVTHWMPLPEPPKEEKNA